MKTLSSKIRFGTANWYLPVHQRLYWSILRNWYVFMTHDFSKLQFLAPSNMTCSNSPSLPDFSAELTSLIVVIDQQVYDESMDGDLIEQTNLNFPGSQIAVVQCKHLPFSWKLWLFFKDGDGFYPKLVLSTTNINLLKDAVNTRATLTAIPTPPPPTVPTTTNVPTTTSYPPVYTLNYASPYPALGLAIDSIVRSFMQQV